MDIIDVGKGELIYKNMKTGESTSQAYRYQSTEYNR